MVKKCLRSGIFWWIIANSAKKEKKKKKKHKFTKLKFYFLRNCYLYKLSRFVGFPFVEIIVLCAREFQFCFQQ